MLSKEEIENIKKQQNAARQAGGNKMQLKPPTIKTLEKLNNVEEGEGSPLIRTIRKDAHGAHQETIKCCISYASGLVVSVSYDKTARIWTAKEGNHLITLEAHKKQVREP